MKIVAISDTHNRHKKIKKFWTEDQDGNELEALGGDVIVHSGDATGRGEKGEILPFLDWFADLDFRFKIFVPGNHDWGFERAPEFYREECKKRGIILLIHESVEIEGVKFWGSPASPWFYSWAFNYRRTLEESTVFNSPWIKNIWDQIPEGTNVLITHGPPHGILDQLVYANGDYKNEFVGCEELKRAITRIKPDIHIFGHIHCAYGEKHLDGTSYYNASICGESYMVDNDPHIIDL